VDSEGEKISGAEAVYVQYNPTTLKISKGVAWTDVKEYSSSEPALEFTTPKPMTVSIELTYDTTYAGAGDATSMNLGERLEQGMANVAAAAASAVGLGDVGGAEEAEYTDVRKMWVNHLINLTIPRDDVQTGAKKKVSSPSPIKMVWKDFEIVAVITKLDTTYTMFGSDGTPIRANVTLELKEYKLATEVDTSLKGTPMDSQNVQLLNPDHGENIYSLAMKFGLDWRMIALANNIDDPTDIADNMDLIIPMVTGGKI
jgi:hypothetical protein